MDYGLLGEVRATHAGRALPLGGRRNRALLALLVLNANQPVRTEDIAEQVWGPRDSPPRSTIQAQLHRLRSTLPDAVIDTTQSGYVLHADPGSVDARRFEARLAAAQAALTAGRAAECVQAADEALHLWRGPALCDVLQHDFAVREHLRLQELRREAEEVHAEALLSTNPAAVVTTTTRLVADAPLRERKWAILMRALYLTARQADALAAYGRARRILDEQLGVEPGPELRQLHLQILHHDVVLDEQPIAASSGPLQVRYARTADGPYIAYETFGRGTPLLVSAGNWSGLTIRQNPLSAPYAAQLGEIARVTCYDARGLGMSDPLGNRLPTIEDRTEELLAVADTITATRLVLYGFSDGAAAAIHAAATAPQRVVALILHNAAAASSDETGQPPFPIADREQLADAYERNWGTGLTIDLYAPTLANDPVARRWWAHGERHAARPGEVHNLNLAADAIDVRDDLTRIGCPTLVVHSAANTAVPVEHARFLANHIPGAQLVEIPTPDHAMWSGSNDVLPALRTFLNQVARR